MRHGKLTQLSSTVVANHNAIDAMVHCQQGILGRRDTLDPNLHVAATLLLQPLDIPLPVQRRVRGVRVEGDWALGDIPLAVLVGEARLAVPPLELLLHVLLSPLLPLLLSLGVSVGVTLLLEVGDGEVRRQLELVPDFQVSASEHGRVHGEEDGLVARLFRPCEQLRAVLPLFKQV